MTMIATNAAVAFQTMPHTTGTSDKVTTPASSATTAPPIAAPPDAEAFGLPDDERDRRDEDQDGKKHQATRWPEASTTCSPSSLANAASWPLGNRSRTASEGRRHSFTPSGETTSG
jgi:hypothetical protein